MSKKWYSSFEPKNDSIILSNFCHAHTFFLGTYFIRKRPRWIKGIDEWLILDLDRKAQTEKKNYWIHPRTRIKVLKYLRHKILFFFGKLSTFCWQQARVWIEKKNEKICETVLKKYLVQFEETYNAYFCLMQAP